MDGLIDRAARNVGLYAPDGSLAGYSRTVDAPDAFLVYLADVFVLPSIAATASASSSCASPSTRARTPTGAGCCTPRDAHGLYEKLGFAGRRPSGGSSDRCADLGAR